MEFNDLSSRIVACVCGERADACLGADPRTQIEQPAHVDLAAGVADPGGDDERTPVKPVRLFELLAMGGDPAKLTIVMAIAGLVAEVVLDVQGAAVLRFAFGEVAVVAPEGCRGRGRLAAWRVGCRGVVAMSSGAAVLGFGIVGRRGCGRCRARPW